MAHENAYLARLEAQGTSVLNLRDIEDWKGHWRKRVKRWKAASRQSPRRPWKTGRWFGRSDVLRRVERASKLGGWSYEVYDCKLACETKAATILQLSLYSELLESFREFFRSRCTWSCAESIFEEFEGKMLVVVPEQASIPQAWQEFDDAWNLKDPKLEERVRNVGRQVARFAYFHGSCEANEFLQK